MEATFTSQNKKMNDFLRMARLLGFLETSNNVEDKKLEIKMAREDGLIDEEEAIELALEYC